ncbi:hypothetical protein BJX63DRAFT_96673 [Aspergillus granulosus]|uniref:GPI anchored serine-threonine rich protein n=1 Tax=Aspergillus granulosus TaxID=176169 RepID=A0ABR4HT60_9EURO
MRFLSVVSLLAASVAVLAQGTETSASSPAATGDSCDAQTILDTCLASIQVQVDNCGPNEWDCLCEQTNNLLTCYNNCPRDGGRNGVQQQKVSYCNAAEAAGLLSSTTSTSATTTSTATSTASQDDEATPTSSGAASPEPSDDAAAGVSLDGRLGGLVGVGLAVLGILA